VELPLMGTQYGTGLAHTERPRHRYESGQSFLTANLRPGVATPASLQYSRSMIETKHRGPLIIRRKPRPA